MKGPIERVYCLQRCADGRWLFLNRFYKPFGEGFPRDQWADYDRCDGARAVLTDAQIRQLANGRVPYQKGDARAWLFFDGTHPESSRQLRHDYERREALLWQLRAHNATQPTPPMAPVVTTTQPTPPIAPLVPTVRPVPPVDARDEEAGDDDAEEEEVDDDAEEEQEDEDEEPPAPSRAARPDTPLLVRWSDALRKHNPVVLARGVPEPQIAAVCAACQRVSAWVAVYFENLKARTL
jgi:hypothetical protein